MTGPQNDMGSVALRRGGLASAGGVPPVRVTQLEPGLGERQPCPFAEAACPDGVQLEDERQPESGRDPHHHDGKQKHPVRIRDVDGALRGPRAADSRFAAADLGQ